MIDTHKVKWTLSESEEAVIQWLTDNDFSGEVTRQCMSKLILSTEKNGVSLEMSIPDTLSMDNVPSFVAQFNRLYEMQIELEHLRAEKRQMGG